MITYKLPNAPQLITNADLTTLVYDKYCNARYGVVALVTISVTVILAVTPCSPVSCYQHFFCHDDRFFRNAGNELPIRTAKTSIWNVDDKFYVFYLSCVLKYEVECNL
jgi:hypothetical protein